MIGIFDSGLGGLSALREARALMPDTDFIYFGDTGRVPYGTRSEETILRYARGDVNFLRSMGVSAILAACGTVSSVALDELKKTCDLPLVGVVSGASRDAAAVTRVRRVAVLGTGATIRSGRFDRELHAIDPKIEVTGVACPLFVPLVENGYIARDCAVTRLVAEEYLAPVRASGADTVILGCTHFPIIAPLLADLLPGVALISSGAAAARELLPFATREGGRTRYFVSDAPSSFAAVASIFLGEDVSAKAEKINIESFE